MEMYNILFNTHKISVILFLLIYLVKTILLLANNKNALAKVTKIVKVPEMIVSTLFLLTGIYMLTQVPEIKTMMVLKIVIVFLSIPVAIIGFKKSNKIMAVLSLLMIISAYGLAEMSRKHKAVEGNTEAITLNNGQDIYSANCVKCHGDDGKLGLMGASDLSTTQLDKNGIIDIIKNGKGAMVGFNRELTDKGINMVADHVQSLKK